MSTLTQDDIAAFVTTNITSADATLEHGNRSPRKVGELLAQMEPLRIEDAIRTAEANDTTIYRALVAIRAHHTTGYRYDRDTKTTSPFVNWSAAAATWSKVLDLLRQFRDQTGGQRLLDPHQTVEFLREMRQNMQSATERATA